MNIMLILGKYSSWSYILDSTAFWMWDGTYWGQLQLSPFIRLDNRLNGNVKQYIFSKMIWKRIKYDNIFYTEQVLAEYKTLPHYIYVIYWWMLHCFVQNLIL